VGTSLGATPSSSVTDVVQRVAAGLIQPDGAIPGADTWGSGDPVYAATGDLSYSSTDLSIPGGGVPLDFTRTYDAQEAQTQAADHATVPPLGYGWTDNLGMTVAYNSSAQVETVTEASGAQMTYTNLATDTTPPAWCANQVTYSTSGTIVISGPNWCSIAPRFQATLNYNGTGNSNDVWTFVEYQGAPVSYYFNAAGQLTRVTDSAGNYLQSASYTQSQCTTGHCTIWTSYTADDAATGISLVLESSSSGQLESVFDPDSSTQTATFSYVGSGCSSWTGTQVADLCGSVDPGGITAQYTYNVTNPTANLDYDLTGYTQPGATAQTATQYNPDGQVIQQIDPTVDVTTYGYTSDNATLNATLAGGTTTVSTYPDGSGTGEPKNSNAYTFSNNTMVAETVGVGSQYPITTTYKIDPYSLLPLKTTDGDGHITSYSYEPDNVSPISAINLLSSTDAMGNTTQYRYTNDNLLYCEVSPAETAKGDVTCPSSPPALDTPVPGATINYYNANGQMVETVDPLGGTTTYSYTSTNDGVPSGLLYCEVDPASYDLDVQCPATYLDPPMSGTTSYTYDQAGDKTSETDPDGNTTTYAYTDSAHPGMVTSETDQAGTTTSFTYNAAGEITSKIVSFSGDSYTSSTLYAYDAYGRQICQVTPDAAAAGITCPASGPGATVTTYDAAGRIIRTVNPLGGTSLTAYDQTGRPFCTVAPAQIAAGITCPASSSVSDPGATITVYDGAGQATQVTNPLGGVQTTSYDAAGNVQQTVSVSGTSPSVTTDYGYDADNQQTSVEVDPGGAQQATTFQRYDPDGHVYCSVSADNSGSYRCPTWQASWIDTPPSPTQDLPGISTNVTTNFYNANGQLIQSTNPDDQTSIQIVDGDGRVTCSADPANMASWLAANQSSHYPYMCTSDEPGSGYTFSQYDSNGNVLETTDPLDHATTNHYGADNLLLYSENPLGEKIAYCYYYQSCASGAPADSGTADDLFSMTTPTTATDLDGQITYYTYGPDGQITTTTSTAGITTTSYNDAGAVQSVEYSGTASGYSTPHNITYSYNTDGTRHTMIDATGTTTYLYNVTGEVTSQALTALVGTGLSGSTTTYGYNTQGALTSVTYPGNSDPKATYSYDAAGILVSVTDWNGHQITFAHDGDGNPTAQDNNVGSANPKGTSSTTFSYDPADINSDASSTVACSHAGSQTVDQFFSGSGGSTNVDGQLTRYTISYSGPCTNPATYEQDYSYNQDGQLIYQGSSPQGTSPANFGYDSAGDLATISETDSSGNLVSWGQHYDNAGELTSQTPDTGNPGTATTYSYDTLGDQTGSTGGTDASYNYNQAGQMVSADSGQTTYLYDGDGLQAAVTTPSGTSQMVWDTAGQLPLLLSDGTYDYVYGTGSTPVEQIKLSDGTSTFMSYSPSNSTWLTTNASGTETGLWGYDAYGTLTFGTPTSSFGYAGQYTGPSGLDSMRVRQYDPQTGQFTTVDPALASTGQPYGYADGDPVNNADPTGLAAGWLSSAFNWAGNEAQTVGENLVDEGEAAASDVTGLAGVNINPTFSTAAGDFAYEMTAILGQLAMAGEDGLAPATEDSTEGEASAGGSGLNNLSPALQSALRALGLSGGGPVTLDAATDEAGEGTVSVFHGSINNLHDILANGLQNTEDGAYASPYLEPSVDAAEFSGRVIPPGADTGIVESRIPVGLYKAIMAPLEERYGGFSGNLAGRGFTEIHLMTPEQIKLFNDYIVSEPVSASRWEGLCMVSLLK